MMRDVLNMGSNALIIGLLGVLAYQGMDKAQPLTPNPPAIVKVVEPQELNLEGFTQVSSETPQFNNFYNVQEEIILTETIIFKNFPKRLYHKNYWEDAEWQNSFDKNWPDFHKGDY